VSEAAWKALHPLSVGVNLVPQAWRTLKGFWPLALALFIGRKQASPTAADLGIVVLFFALTVLRTVVHFFTLRYRVSDDRLEIRTGLLSRQIRVIDPSRIQNVELVRNLFHKAAGLVELRIETAGGTSTEGLLSALGEREAEELRAALKQTSPSSEPARPEDVLLRNSAAELIGYGLSERRLGYVALILAFGFDIFTQVGEDARSVSPALFVAAVLAAFAVAWILAGGQSLFRHYDFSLVRHGDVLVTEEGLTTRRRVEIPVRKVQVVRIDEPLVRRLLGFATVLVETAGLGVQDGRLRQAEAVLPMVAREEIDHIVGAAAPVAAVAPASLVLHPAHPRALVRGVLGRILRVAFFGAITGAVFFPWGFLTLTLAPLTVPVAWLDWRTQGWLVTPVAVVCRRGFFLRRTWVVARDKLQSVHVGEGPLSRALGLSHVIVRVAGTTVSLPEVALADGLAIHEELARA
jgi:putative membrane protein